MFLVRSYEKSGCAERKRRGAGMMVVLAIIFACGCLGCGIVGFMLWIWKRDRKAWNEKY